MSINCTCTHCQVALKLPAKLAGSKARCPKCKQVFVIPRTVDQNELPPDTAVQQPRVAESLTANEANPLQTTESQPLPSAMPVDPARPPSGVVPLARPLTAVRQGDSAPQAVLADSIIPQATAVDSRNPVVQSVGPLRKRRRGVRAIMGLLLGLLALTGCLAVLGGLAYWLSLQGTQIGKVIIQIPVEHRRDCAMFVDGQATEINRIGPIEIELVNGSHEIELRRLGFEPVNLQLVIAARQNLPVTPNWRSSVESPEPVPEEPPPEDTRPLDPVEAALGAPVGAD